MSLLPMVFWIGALAAIYAYVGYPVVLWVWAAARRSAARPSRLERREFPPVTMIVPVHNERSIILEKLANTEGLRYPGEKLEALFVSDGSTDGTAEAIEAHAVGRIRLIVLPGRGGKAGALNAGLAAARHDIIVFSDASIMLEPDALEEIVQPFSDSGVGCVSGEDWIAERGGEGLYGRYELHLRRLESRLGSIVGASGSFYAQRRVLCDQFVPNVAPDFLSVLITVGQGFRAISCPTARGRMSALATPGQEYDRKVRTILRGITTLARNLRLLNPLRTGSFAFVLASHKLARWLVPFSLMATGLSSALLAGSSPIYAVALWVQLALWVVALAGIYGPGPVRRSLAARIAVFFLVVNLATLHAWLKFARGSRQEVWAPTRRGLV